MAEDQKTIPDSLFETCCINDNDKDSIYSRLHLIYPLIIETVKDWADCKQLTPIEVGQIFTQI